MINEELIKSTKIGEGLRLKPYRCTANKLTIGYGRNLEDVGISEKEAEYLLMNDLGVAEKEAKKFDYFERLNQPRKNVIIEMVLNMGFVKVGQFKKMAEAIRNGNFEEAGEQMIDSNWAKQVGSRAYRLSLQMKKGEYVK